MAHDQSSARLLCLERAQGLGARPRARHLQGLLAEADRLILEAPQLIGQIQDTGPTHRVQLCGNAAWSSLRWRGHILGRDAELWTQACYAACANAATTIPDYPGFVWFAQLDGRAQTWPRRGWRKRLVAALFRQRARRKAVMTAHVPPARAHPFEISVPTTYLVRARASDGLPRSVRVALGVSRSAVDVPRRHRARRRGSDR